ncbi:MAG: BlaI/MecI/CopY family transcriptional regulator [Clostridia bacterium]|nr:BlaI/MecI/CopY family transcriptional regulator [Clostridia bacterium]
MEEVSICDSELKLMNIIWDMSPIESGKLVKVCAEKLDWSKSTTYTILRRLTQKELVRNEDSIVEFLIPHENFQRMESNKVIEKTFSGSLPKFVAAFLGSKSISDEEADELIKMIKNSKGGAND